MFLLLEHYAKSVAKLKLSELTSDICVDSDDESRTEEFRKNIGEKSRYYMLLG